MSLYDYITQDELHLKWFTIGYKAYRNLNCNTVSIMISDLKSLGKSDSWIKRLCHAKYSCTSNKIFMKI